MQSKRKICLQIMTNWWTTVRNWRQRIKTMADQIGKKQAASSNSPEVALASEIFDQFCNATTLKSILGYYRQLCELLKIRPNVINQFYPKLKTKLRSWKAQALWKKFDQRANHKCYNRGKICPNTRVSWFRIFIFLYYFLYIARRAILKVRSFRFWLSAVVHVVCAQP